MRFKVEIVPTLYGVNRQWTYRLSYTDDNGVAKKYSPGSALTASAYFDTDAEASAAANARADAIAHLEAGGYSYTYESNR